MSERDSAHDHEQSAAPADVRRTAFIPALVVLGVLVVLSLGGVLLRHAEAGINHVALAAAPKPVTVMAVQATTFRGSRTYVGTLEPWVLAAIGPQLVSAFVDTVLVRPGEVVKKGDVLATLDCRNASATSQAVAMQARALDARQKAVAHEAARVQGLLEGGFVSPNEAEQKAAQSASEQAQLLATQAKLLGTALEVNDCILRAPFDGEVATRNVDPGAFARPGTAIVSIVDRAIVRVTADAPEVDFDVVAPGTQVDVHVLSTGQDLVAQVSRRAPVADESTRTIRFEIDVPNRDRMIPVGTTSELRIDVGQPVTAVEVPLSAVSVRGSKGSIFVVENGAARARSVPVLGEVAGKIYLDATLAPGSLVVLEGRALLNDGDKVQASVEHAASATPAPGASSAAAPGKAP